MGMVMQDLGKHEEALGHLRREHVRHTRRAAKWRIIHRKVPRVSDGKQPWNAICAPF